MCRCRRHARPPRRRDPRDREDGDSGLRVSVELPHARRSRFSLDAFRRHSGPSEDDVRFMNMAVECALESEREGQLPIGCVVVLDGEVIARGGNKAMQPYHPGRHAETVALSRVEERQWGKARQMTLYTTLEPCLMCMGCVLLHGIGRVVFGAFDTGGGCSHVLPYVPLIPYYHRGLGVPDFVGPIAEELCNPLYARVRAVFGIGAEGAKDEDEGVEDADVALLQAGRLVHPPQLSPIARSHLSLTHMALDPRLARQHRGDEIVFALRRKHVLPALTLASAAFTASLGAGFYSSWILRNIFLQK